MVIFKIGDGVVSKDKKMGIVKKVTTLKEADSPLAVVISVVYQDDMSASKTYVFSPDPQPWSVDASWYWALPDSHGKCVPSIGEIVRKGESLWKR